MIFTEMEEYIYGSKVRITAMEAIFPNCSLAVGDIVAMTCTDMMTATMASPAAGTPRALTFANTAGNSPSSAAALAVCPTRSVQPASEPRQPTAAQMATAFPAIGPSASRAASANGADDAINSLFGIMP